MRILLVEDEIGLSDAVEAILKKEGYEVDAAHDGPLGLSLGCRNRYDCIVLDIMLPGMNGLDVLSCLRVREVETPVLLLTAKAEVDDRIRGLDCGADDYLTKPFATGELLARLRALTRRHPQQEASPSFGDLTLNIRQGELQRGSSRVALGKKEMQMMELLMAAEGNIVTKEQLAQKIWGGGDESDFNNVEVYVSFLRKKLTLLRSAVQIRTKRGVGYLLSGEGRL